MNSNPEQNSFSNSFGSVYSNRIEFKTKKHWWSGGKHEELPLRHITSVSLETSRSIILSGILVLIGAACVSSGEVGVVILGVVLGLIGLVLLVGHPSVAINTAGQDRRHIAGAPGSKSDADEFVKAVREKMYDAK